MDDFFKRRVEGCLGEARHWVSEAKNPHSCYLFWNCLEIAEEQIADAEKFLWEATPFWYKGEMTCRVARRRKRERRARARSDT